MIRASGDMFEVGVVTGVHGLRGDLKVRPHTPGSMSLMAARFVCLAKAEDAAGAPYEVCRAVAHKSWVLLRLKGHESIEAVADFKGARVFMALADLPEPDEEESYWYELQGAEVHDKRLGLIGTLDDIFETPAHDIYVVQGHYGEVLIPAVDEFIVEFDEEQRLLVVDLPAGLVNEEDAD